MSLPRRFLNYDNFELAFTRIVRGGNKEYKKFYRHLFPSYNFALKQNLEDLIKEIKKGIYKPTTPTVVYQPKKSGVLRPLTLLSLCDLIVYQALVNIIAEEFEIEQRKYALKKSFGAIFAGKYSDFFYRSWRVCYSVYNLAITKAFKAKNVYVADFDLVSFYELIDHHLLQSCLEKKVKSGELLNLLFKCLEAWTMEMGDQHCSHGIPQGPEPSAFLAECFLFHFDGKMFKNVKYLRYVDDIKLMAKSDVPLRRALLKLDLASKELGLVPQAQKIEPPKKVASLKEIQKTIPSAVALSVTIDQNSTSTQKELMKMFRKSLQKEKKQWIIDDITKFRYSLLRLNPRMDVLKRIAPMLTIRPDCSRNFAIYLRKFPKNKVAADILLQALMQDPTYDASAANYIEAMDVCEPATNNASYRRVIQTINRRSEEKSILLTIASLTFRGRRSGPKDAVGLIKKQENPIARGILLHRLFGDAPNARYNVTDCKSLLEREIKGDDQDLARFCASLLFLNFPSWHSSRPVNKAVKLLMLGLGLRKRAPKKTGVFEAFFKNKMKIFVPIPWRKALGKDLRNAESKCLRLQELQVGDPSARIMILDTFNEILLQAFSLKHPNLITAYSKAAAGSHPDLGNWLNNPLLSKVLPKGIAWYKDVHNTRVAADLSHAKMKSGKKKGAPTKPVSFREAENLMKKSQAAWAELIIEWKKVL